MDTVATCLTQCICKYNQKFPQIQEAGASFDMAGTCEKAFKDNYQNGNIPDGAMVITDAGRIQNVKKIMHLKIPQKWESSNGRKVLLLIALGTAQKLNIW